MKKWNGHSGELGKVDWYKVSAINYTGCINKIVPFIDVLPDHISMYLFWFPLNVRRK